MEFSSVRLSEFKKSELPLSAFLMGGDPKNHETWHLPIRDMTNNVNTHLLEGAKQLIDAGELKGVKPAFEIPGDVKDVINNFWEAYQRSTGSTGKGDVPRETVEMLLSGSHQGSSLLKKALSVAQGGAIDGLGIFDISENWMSAGLDFDKDKHIIYNAVLGTEGWSTHGWGFTEEWANSLVPKIVERAKMYNGHELDPVKMGSRLPTEWVATVNNPRVVIANSGKFSGRSQVIGDLHYVETDVGNQLWKVSHTQPEQTHLSIHSRNKYRKNMEFDGRKGNVCLQCLNHVSTDFVSYGALNGGVSVPNSVLASIPGYVQGALSDPDNGIYLIYDNPLSKENSLTEVSGTLNAHQQKTKVSAGYKKTTKAAAYCMQCRFFIPPYGMYSDGGYRLSPQEKVGRCSLVEGDINPQGYTSTLFEAIATPSLNTTLRENANIGDPNSIKENPMKYGFDSLEALLANAEVKAAIAAQFPKMKTSLNGKEFTVEELTVALQTATKERDDLKKEKTENERQAAQVINFNAFITEYKIPVELVSDEFKEECLACATKEDMETKIKGHVKLMKAIATKATQLAANSEKNGNGAKVGKDDEFLVSLVDGQNSTDKPVTDKEFWGRYDDKK